MISRTLHEGRVVAAHATGDHRRLPREFPQRDARRSKLHVTNVRRVQREAKRSLEALFA
jgi:hypothetical protein